ncbi:Os05g0349000 [Oryza sativa Japonica Group]|uniref:Os05g0349000 protein n=2 Tax=Oryza sativa subsp. japonica TaxID=39947 RepID=C7J2B1_ORYSJ|nr:unknown protein [Oryza sativa Japonica Group]KAF2930324.1 hypothetical protein DAI22_05g126200 [Oryza sativa Japonica Group]BAG92092.1 unnamed protein product [Oryza sativa Japonica Group]BAH00156.1 unnamed protein product [Oryza sativa Japonica Group]BAH93103.1 Os05g0349000 [Oryza sativa Japonica Group]|eukprot:NP_001174375.1 Os05g0349000 [Oryza sativa Japonica Group]
MDATSMMGAACFDVQRAQLFPRNGADVTPTKSSASGTSGTITKPVAESTAVAVEHVFPATPASSAPLISSTAMMTPISLTMTKEADADMGKVILKKNNSIVEFTLINRVIEKKYSISTK